MLGAVSAVIVASTNAVGDRHIEIIRAGKRQIVGRLGQIEAGADQARAGTQLIVRRTGRLRRHAETGIAGGVVAASAGEVRIALGGVGVVAEHRRLPSRQGGVGRVLDAIPLDRAGEPVIVVVLVGERVAALGRCAPPGAQHPSDAVPCRRHRDVVGEDVRRVAPTGRANTAKSPGAKVHRVAGAGNRIGLAIVAVPDHVVVEGNGTATSGHGISHGTGAIAA